MRKKTGTVIIEWYDEYGSKSGSQECTSYTHAKKISDLWESLNSNNSCVISHIMYNTKCQINKWDHKTD